MTIFVDRLSTTSLLDAARDRLKATAGGDSTRFWSTPPRNQADPTREVLEVNLTSARLVNYIGLASAHFPHTLTVEYQDGTGSGWMPLRTLPSLPATWWTDKTVQERQAAVTGSPLTLTVQDSVPAIIPQVAGREHPQHRGAGHWISHSWRTTPVLASRVRFVLVRSGYGGSPADMQGRPVPYSLGLRDIEVGYRVTARADAPRFGDIVSGVPAFASSEDVLGSRVTYALRTRDVDLITDGSDATAWRCAPQPVNYAVVNLYVDTRTPQGDGQVIDRFTIDPETHGPTLNLYYSNDDSTDVEALDAPLAAPEATLVGQAPAPTYLFDQALPDNIALSGAMPSYVDIDNTLLHFDPRKAWWFGVNLRVWADGMGNAPSGDTPFTSTTHPWLSIGNDQIRQVANTLEYRTAAGDAVVLTLPAEHTIGQESRVTVGYTPPQDDRSAIVTISYQSVNHDLHQVHGVVTTSTTQPDHLLLGTDPGKVNNSALKVRGLVLKAEELSDDVNAAFLAEPDLFVLKSPFSSLDMHLTDNAVIRMHPQFYSADPTVTALVGGIRPSYETLVWTPVPRDYVLAAGDLLVPPTKAKFWKMEFTNLVAEAYDNFVPIRRNVRIFSPNTVQRWQDVLSQGTWSPSAAAPGVQTMLNLSDYTRYSDAVNALYAMSNPSPSGHSPTEMLVSTDLGQANRISDLGWVWSYQPWHIGSSAPRFYDVGQHVYDIVPVDHTAKVGFFVGIKSIVAKRVDYTVEDDTEAYVDHFGDSGLISELNGFALGSGRITAFGFSAQMTSQVMKSYRPVRAVQFATVESEPIQLLSDTDFQFETLTDNWAAYGDAQVSRDPDTGRVTLTRGWNPRSYGTLESDTVHYGTYANLEGTLYGVLEGSRYATGAYGGLVSKNFSASNSGRLYAAVQVSSDQGLSQPLSIEIVSSTTGYIYASASRTVAPGERATFSAALLVGAVLQPSTYQPLEGVAYGDITGTYGDHESVAILEDLYVRVSQDGPTNDTFTVHRMAVYDVPIVWEFSVDGGTTWYPAPDVRNNPQGVLTFPVPDVSLCWRALAYRPGATVSALVVRPWYLGDAGPGGTELGLTQAGPNRSSYDHALPIGEDPMWLQWSSPIPRSWYQTGVQAKSMTVSTT